MHDFSMLTQKTTKSFSNAQQASAVYSALLPETRSAHEKRARTTLTVKNNRLTITSIGNDLPYVHASQDTYGKLVSYLQSLEKKGD